MVKRYHISIFVACIFLLIIIVLQNFDIDDKTHSINGTWRGVFVYNEISLRLEIDISSKDSNYSGVLYSVDQNEYIIIPSINFNNSNITFLIKDINASFNGEMESHSSISGVWHQNGIKVPIKFSKHIKEVVSDTLLDGIHYKIEEVQETIIGNDGQVISGTLTKPLDAEKVALIILTSGSGAQTRNSKVYNKNIFLTWSNFLAHSGIATFRYDDRGKGESEGSYLNSTYNDLSGDLIHIVKYYSNKDFVNINKIGLLGHSEGCTISAITANKIPELIDFLILISPPMTPGKTTIVNQYQMLAEYSNSKTCLKNFELDLIIMLLDNILLNKETLFPEDFLNIALSAVDTTECGFEEYKYLLERFITAANKKKSYYSSRIFCDLVVIDPAIHIRGIRSPIFAYLGSLDKQVNANESAVRLNEINNYNKNITIKIYEDYNHIMEKADSGLPSEYYSTDENSSKRILIDVFDWVSSI